MGLRINNIREGGEYTIETYGQVSQGTWPYAKFETMSLAVVYADHNLPSHCVRRFLFSEQEK